MISVFPKGDAAPISSNIVPWAFLPTDGTVMPDGRFAVVATGANDDLEVQADVVKVGGTVFDWSDIACEAEETWHVEDDSQIVAVDFAGTPGRRREEPLRIYIGDAAIPLDIPPAEESVEDAIAFELFQKGAQSGMTCAGCHPEGLEDGRVWLFNEVGARRTQSMAGGIGDTAPFHWGGEFLNFDELMIEVFVTRMGHPALPQVERQACGRGCTACRRPL